MYEAQSIQFYSARSASKERIMIQRAGEVVLSLQSERSHAGLACAAKNVLSKESTGWSSGRQRTLPATISKS